MHILNRKRIAALAAAAALGAGATGVFAYMYASATGGGAASGVQISTLATVSVSLSGATGPSGYFAGPGTSPGSCSGTGPTALLPGDCVSFGSADLVNTSSTETVDVTALALTTWSSSASTCTPTNDPGLFTFTQNVVPSGGLIIAPSGTSTPGGLAFTMVNTTQNDGSCAGSTITFTLTAS